MHENERLSASRHRNVLQVQVLVVHGVAQLPDLLLYLGQLFGTKLDAGVRLRRGSVVLVQLEEPDHQVQTGPVQVHVQPVAAQDVHQSCCAQSQVLKGEQGEERRERENDNQQVNTIWVKALGSVPESRIALQV